LIENISFYSLSWPELNFGCYLTFEIIFKALLEMEKQINFFQVAGIFLPAINATVFNKLLEHRFDNDT